MRRTEVKQENLDIDFRTAVQMLNEGVPTVLIPCFTATPRAIFVKEVIARVTSGLKAPEPSRIYLIFQEGITKKQVLRVMGKVKSLAERKLAREEMESDYVHLYVFGNIPLEVIQHVMAKVSDTEIALY